MRFSKKRLGSQTREEIIKDFYQVLADLHSDKETKTFLQDFLTEAELLSLAKRLAIAFMLEKGSAYGEIKKRLGVSSATIASVQEMMQKKSGGFALALKKIEAEKWAQDATQKVSNFFKTFLSSPATSK